MRLSKNRGKHEFSPFGLYNIILVFLVHLSKRVVFLQVLIPLADVSKQAVIMPRAPALTFLPGNRHKQSKKAHRELVNLVSY